MADLDQLKDFLKANNIIFEEIIRNETEIEKVQNKLSQTTLVVNDQGELWAFKLLNKTQQESILHTLSSFVSIQYLDVSFCALKQLPISLQAFTNLHILNIRGNSIEILPDWLQNLTNLQELYMGYNDIVILPDWLQNLTNLQILGFSGNRIKFLPDWLQSVNLHELYMSDINLETLPDWLQRLTSLQALDISGNNLGTLPDWLQNLTNLKKLHIGHNGLKFLPDWLQNLTSLQALDISGNNLGTLPDWLQNLTNLQDLCISYNRLITLPESLQNLTKLQELNISNNLLGTPPGVVRKFILQPINASGNNLGTLPDWLQNLTNLQTLDISYNGLKFLPDWLQNLTSLQALDISGNNLGTLPDWLQNLTNLKILLICNNELTVLSDWLQNLTNLKKLDISDNHFQTIPLSLLPLLQKLNVSTQNVEIFGVPEEIVKQGWLSIEQYYNAITKKSLQEQQLSFKQEVAKRIEKFSHSQLVYFTGICAIRALPFLCSVSVRQFSFWKDHEKLTKLYTVFRALDYNLGYNKVHMIENVTGAYIVADDTRNVARTAPHVGAVYAIYAAYAAAYAVYATETARSAYTVDTAAAYAAENVDNAVLATTGKKKLLEAIIIKDIECIETNRLDLLNNDMRIYGDVWRNFQDDLNSVGCGYWAKLYTSLFANRFVVDEKELERRLNVPDEIKAQGAAAVAKFLETVNPDMQSVPNSRLLDSNGSDVDPLFVATVKSRLTLTLNKGFVGGRITVIGTVENSDSIISIYWNSITPANKLSSIQLAGSSRDFTVDIIIPHSPVGVHTIFAVAEPASDGVSDATFLSVDFTVIPKITLNPNKFTKDGVIVVTGTGFAANINNANITIAFTFDNLSLETTRITQTDANGDFRALLSVPDLSDGTYAVVATDSIGNTANTLFSIGSVIILAPSSGPSGTVVTITGHGFTPNATVFKVDFDDIIISVSDVTVNASGNFTVQIVVPLLPVAGDKQIVVTEMIDGVAGRSASAKFSVTGLTSITASPIVAQSGVTAITITGSNFTRAPKTVVVLILTSSNMANSTYQLGSAVVNSYGSFTVTITIPTDVPVGSYILNATDVEGLTAKTDLTVTKLMPINAPFTDFISNLPSLRNSYFTGRTKVIAAIRQNFQAKKSVYISGMGGVGKSSVALEYAYKHKDDYDVIWWLNAGDHTEIQNGFKEFAIRKNLINSDEQNEEAVILRKVQEWLNTHQRWLFIYDNADEKGFKEWLGQYLSRSGTGDVIVTTRCRYFSEGVTIVLDEFDKSEALEFLKKRTGRVDVKAKDLADCLGYFPLALEQAAAYLVATPMSYEEYIAVFEEKLEHDEDLTHYDKSVYATLQMSIDRLERDGAWQMLNLCAYFAPDRIPLSLFVESKIFSETLKVNVDVYDIVAELAKYSLLKYDKDDHNLVYIHRLLQATVRRRHKYEDTRWLNICFDMVYGVFRYEYGDKASMDAFGQNVAHVLEIARHAELMLDKTDKAVQEKIAVLYSEAGLGFYYGGRYVEALEWLVKALAIRESVLGKDHPSTADTYNNIARVYGVQGRYVEALELYSKALAIRESVFGKDHPDTANTYHNIATVCMKQGDYDKALEWNETALVIYEQVLGKGHLSTRAIYIDIAEIYKARGDEDKAAEFYKKADKVHKTYIEPSEIVAEPFNPEVIEQLIISIINKDLPKATEIFKKITANTAYRPVLDGLFFVKNYINNVESANISELLIKTELWYKFSKHSLTNLETESSFETETESTSKLVVKSESDVSDSTRTEDDKSKKKLTNTEIKAGDIQRKGAELEETVLQLLEKLFSDDGEIVIDDLSKQSSGSQYGRDINLDYRSEGVKVRCRIECKNIASKLLSLKEISDKVTQIQMYTPKDVKIDCFIVVSPFAEPSTDLKAAVEFWNHCPNINFNTHIWSPNNGVKDFFRLDPQSYDKFYSDTKNHQYGCHPKKWEPGQKEKIIEKFKRYLRPCSRLPIEWQEYTIDPKMLLSNQKEATYPVLYDRYIDLEAKADGQSFSLIEYVYNWLAKDSSKTLVVLGEFGDGKSFFTYYLSRKLLENYNIKKEGWIPLRFSLQEYETINSPNNFVQRRLKRMHQKFFGSFGKVIREDNNFLIILDGFDEMSKKIDVDNVTSNTDKIIEFYRYFKNNYCGNIKFLITSRKSFFNENKKRKEMIENIEAHQIVEITPLSRDKQVIPYLLRYAETDDEREQINNLRFMYDPLDLATKPLFLTMLQNNMKKLNMSHLTVENLYNRFIDDSIADKFENLGRNSTDTLSYLRPRLINVLKRISVELHKSKTDWLSLSTFFVKSQDKQDEKLLWELSEPDEVINTTVKTDEENRIFHRSLLVRTNDSDENSKKVTFCFRSMGEFFVANAVYDMLNNPKEDDCVNFLKKCDLNNEIVFFVSQLLKADTEKDKIKTKLLGFLNKTRNKAKNGAYVRLGRNAVNILYKTFSELPGVDYCHMALNGANLYGANLDGKHFSYASLRNANLYNVSFRRSKFIKSDLTGALFGETFKIVSLVKYDDKTVYALYDDNSLWKWDLPTNTAIPIVIPKPDGERLKFMVLPFDKLIMLEKTNKEHFVFYNKVSNKTGKVCSFKKEGNSEENTFEKEGSFEINDVINILSFNDLRQSIEYSQKTNSPSDNRLSYAEHRLFNKNSHKCQTFSQASICCVFGDEKIVTYADGLLKFVIDNDHIEKVVSDGLCVSVHELDNTNCLVGIGCKGGTVCLIGLKCSDAKWALSFDKPLKCCDANLNCIVFINDTTIAVSDVTGNIYIINLDKSYEIKNPCKPLSIKIFCEKMEIDGLKSDKEYNKLNKIIKDTEEASNKKADYPLDNVNGK